MVIHDHNTIATSSLTHPKPSEPAAWNTSLVPKKFLYDDKHDNDNDDDDKNDNDDR